MKLQLHEVESQRFGTAQDSDIWRAEARNAWRRGCWLRSARTIRISLQSSRIHSHSGEQSMILDRDLAIRMT